MDKLELILPYLIPFFPICRGYGDKRLKMNKRGENPRIIVFGNMRDINTGKIISCKGDKKFPLIKILLEEIAKEHFPDFKYTNFQINHNVECLPHYDSKNAGNQYIFTLGNFTNGFLGTENGNVSIYKNPININGSKIKHWTEPFEGDRFCVIFYSNISRQPLKGKNHT